MTAGPLTRQDLPRIRAAAAWLADLAEDPGLDPTACAAIEAWGERVLAMKRRAESHQTLADRLRAA